MAPRTPLSDRDLGWLRFTYRRAMTPDDWDRSAFTLEPGRGTRPIPVASGDGCCPSDHWDTLHMPPAELFGRNDALKSSYALALMAERTPAWREVYDQVFDQLIHRYTSWWGVVDWMTQIGHDPERGNYPDAYRYLIPASQWGNYDVPGWTANGTPPWGYEPDPIAADGMLFYKGFFLVMLGLHRRSTGSDRWNKPFDMVRDGLNTFSWSHGAIADKLADQWRANPRGIHCENTKIWPFCLSGAGLGLQLADNALGTTNHAVYEDWTARRTAEWPAAPKGMVNFYYDPIVDEHVFMQRLRAPVEEFWLAAQVPEVARAQWDVSRERAGIDDEQLARDGVGARVRAMYDKLPKDGLEPGVTWSWIFLAREWGLTDLADELLAVADERYGPTWDRTRGEFTWTFGLDEDHPRGQPNGLMAAAVAVEPGAWSTLTTTRIDDRLNEPTVLGVDFPTLALSQAEWIAGDQKLLLQTEAINESAVGRPTSFRVRGLPDPSRFTVTSPSGGAATARAWGSDLLVETTVGQHRLEIVAA